MSELTPCQVLVRRLADHQPRFGFTSSAQLRPYLTLPDLVTVVRQDPDVLAKACTSDATLEHIIDILESETCIIRRGAMVWAGIEGALNAHVRTWLLPEVQEECYRRQELVNADVEREFRAHKDRTNDQIIADELGMGRTFRG